MQKPQKRSLGDAFRSHQKYARARGWKMTRRALKQRARLWPWF